MSSQLAAHNKLLNVYGNSSITGVGKTPLDVGLGIQQAINKGYKAIFTSTGELVHTLKIEVITKKSQTRMKRIRNADLVIDDLMFMAMNQEEANFFFHLINDLYSHACIILTSNKARKEWGRVIRGSIHNNSYFR